MRVKSFVSAEDPTPEQLAAFDAEVSLFLETVDNVKRFLNGRNSYVIGKRAYVLIWYLEAIAQEVVVTPFGQKEETKNEQANNTETAKA
jgi:hypothetical protein